MSQLPKLTIPSMRPKPHKMEVNLMAVELFRLPTDGRSWKFIAKRRRRLLHRISWKANGNGQTEFAGRVFTPGLTDLKRSGFAEATVLRLTRDLKKLGLLTWTRANRQRRRSYIITVPDQSSSGFVPRDDRQYQKRKIGLRAMW